MCSRDLPLDGCSLFISLCFMNASVVVVAWIIYISHTNAEINKRDLKLYQPATAIDRNDKLMHASGRVANFSTGGSHNLNTL